MGIDMEKINNQELEQVSGGKGQQKKCEHVLRRISKFGEEPPVYKCTKCGEIIKPE